MLLMPGADAARPPPLGRPFGSCPTVYDTLCNPQPILLLSRGAAHCCLLPAICPHTRAIHQVLGGNVLRVWAEVERVSAQLRAEGALPSVARIEDFAADED